ncbi:DUF3592 domain-containing protein [Burkholderia metallica]|uniref:DUF3592 domain-containing protein n=1 Tax=Burkholderia metallica TaxID=488729 RepID=UPI000D1BD1A8|nr:DUF3592 domain-containing protein [Burkholderia metallica]
MTSKAHKFNYVALVIGLCAAAWALISLSDRLAFIKSSIATQGTVVQLNYGERHPEIAFVTQTGEHVSFPGSFISVEVGDSVPVRYDPSKPLATAKINTFTNMWLETLISAAFAIVFLYAGFTGESFRPKYG